MSRVVRWSPNARTDIREIVTYISRDNPRAAESVEARIYDLVDRLADMAFGRKGRVAGTFEMVVTGLPYIVSYRIDDQWLTVARIIHGAQDWPEGEWPA